MAGPTILAPAPTPAPSPTPAPVAAPPASPVQRVIIVDEKNMFRIWLEEKVARHELSPLEADNMLRDQEAQGKLWTGPSKDSLGSGKIFFKLARDFASWKGAEVYFSKSKAGNDLVTFKGWPTGANSSPARATGSTIRKLWNCRSASQGFAPPPRTRHGSASTWWSRSTWRTISCVTIPH